MLKAVIEDLTRRFAIGNASGAGRQRLRERTDDLVLDLLAALKTASLGEIAETTRALERRRKNRAAIRATTNGSGASRRGHVSSDSKVSAAPEEHAPAPRDPFDITVPSDLLEPGPAPPTAFRETARTPKPKPAPDLPELAVAPSARSERPPPPKVSLRAGEELLRTGGAGAIIRRAKS
jgi:hypothetical protein